MRCFRKDCFANTGSKRNRCAILHSVPKECTFFKTREQLAKEEAELRSKGKAFYEPSATRTETRRLNALLKKERMKKHERDESENHIHGERSGDLPEQ